MTADDEANAHTVYHYVLSHPSPSPSTSLFYLHPSPSHPPQPSPSHSPSRSLSAFTSSYKSVSQPTSHPLF